MCVSHTKQVIKTRQPSGLSGNFGEKKNKNNNDPMSGAVSMRWENANIIMELRHQMTKTGFTVLNLIKNDGKEIWIKYNI